MMWLSASLSSPPGGVRSERRRVAKLLSIFSSHANIVYLAAPILLQPVPLSLPSFSPPRISTSLSTHYANMRYQFDGDPRLFLSPILIARPVDRLILAFACISFQCAEIRHWYIELNVFNVRFSHHCENFAARSTRYISNMNIVNVSNVGKRGSRIFFFIFWTHKNSKKIYVM